MHILILGGDGYLGWPTAMYFSNRGYDVTVADNYFRRDACTELDVGMLYPLPTLIERAKIWYEKTGREIKVAIGDLIEPENMRKFFDGRVKYVGTPDQVAHTVMLEKAREARLRELGWIVVRWSWADLADLAGFRRRIEAAIAQANPSAIRGSVRPS